MKEGTGKIGKPKKIELFHTPEDWQEITDWIYKHIPFDRPHLLTAAGMAYNLAIEECEASAIIPNKVSAETVIPTPKNIEEIQSIINTVIKNIEEIQSIITNTLKYEHPAQQECSTYKNSLVQIQQILEGK